MVEMKVTSPKYGDHIVVVDNGYQDLVSSCSIQYDTSGRRICSAVIWQSKNVKLHHAVLRRAGVDIPAGAVVDHIDGNPLNNTLANLRVCDHGTNARNVVARGWIFNGNGYYAKVCVSTRPRWPGDIGHEEDRRTLESFGFAVYQARRAGGKYSLSTSIYGPGRDNPESAREDYLKLKREYHSGVIGREKKG